MKLAIPQVQLEAQKVKLELKHYRESQLSPPRDFFADINPAVLTSPQPAFARDSSPVIFTICGSRGLLLALPTRLKTPETLLEPIDHPATEPGHRVTPSHWAYITGNFALLPESIRNAFCKQVLQEFSPRLGPYFRDCLAQIPEEERALTSLFLCGCQPADEATAKAVLTPLAEVIGRKESLAAGDVLLSLYDHALEWKWDRNRNKQQSLDESCVRNFKTEALSREVKRTCSRYLNDGRNLQETLTRIESIYRLFPDLETDDLIGLALLPEEKLTKLVKNVSNGKADSRRVRKVSEMSRKEHLAPMPMNHPHASSAYAQDLSAVKFGRDGSLPEGVDDDPNCIYLVHTSQRPISSLSAFAQGSSTAMNGGGFYTDAFHSYADVKFCPGWREQENLFKQVYAMRLDPERIAGYHVEDLSEVDASLPLDLLNEWSEGLAKWPCSVEETYRRSNYFPLGEDISPTGIYMHWGRDLPNAVLKSAGLQGYFARVNYSVNEFVVTDPSALQLVATNYPPDELAKKAVSPREDQILCIPIKYDPLAKRLHPIRAFLDINNQEFPANLIYTSKALEAPNVRLLQNVSRELGIPVYGSLITDDDVAGAITPFVDMGPFEKSDFKPQFDWGVKRLNCMDLEDLAGYSCQGNGKILEDFGIAFQDILQTQEMSPDL